MFSMEVVRDLLKRMQENKIVAVEQKEGGTQLKLIIDFEVNTEGIDSPSVARELEEKGVNLPCEL